MRSAYQLQRTGLEHRQLYRIVTVDSSVTEALRTSALIADAKLETPRQFAIVINETRG